MFIVLTCILSVIVVHYAIQVLVWLGLTINDYHDRAITVHPRVSVLLAVRNEEVHIASCIQSLCELNYPIGQLEILIGNDASEDNTVQQVLPFLEKYPHITLFHITENLGKARGKANVLAQLARKATGEYFFITDADIHVNPEWINSMLPHLSDETAMVSGVTIGKGTNTFEHLQAIDWTYFNAVLTGTANLGIPCTAVGNNMLITRKAYLQTGGYEQLEFSVTEDYALYKAVRNLSLKTKNICTVGSYHYTQTLPTFKAILHQRKRWLTGGRQLPLYWWFMLFVFGLFWPCIIVIAYMNPALALKCWLLKFILEAAIINRQLLRLQQPSEFLFLLFHQVYSFISSMAVAIFYFLPFKFVWKNRTY